MADTTKKIDIDHIDYDDKAVLASIGTGRTDGVFQLESGGMKNFMKELLLLLLVLEVNCIKK